MSSLFPGLDSLVGLARHGVDPKPTLLRVLTDLYVQKPIHSDDEERQFVELSLRLIDAVDPTTRELVARKLAAYPGVPELVMARLQGKRVGELPPAPPPQNGRRRADARATTAAFFAGSDSERREMLRALDSDEPLAPTGWPVPAEAVSRRLEESVLAGRPGDFIRELERALQVSRSLAECVVNDRGGEAMVVAARALALPVDVLQRILLFVNPAIGHSVRRVYALTDLYHEISLAAALRLTACWREAEPMAGSRKAAPAPGSAPRPGTPRRLGAPGTMPLGRPQRPATDPARTAADDRSPDDPVEKVAS